MKQILKLEEYNSIDIFEDIMIQFHQGKLRDIDGKKIKDKQTAINLAIEQSQYEKDYN